MMMGEEVGKRHNSFRKEKETDDEFEMIDWFLPSMHDNCNVLPYYAVQISVIYCTVGH